MSPESPVPVVVIGAGPTGTVAAIELGLRGVPCLVLDRWPEVYEQPRAVHLDDEVYRILSRLGIGEQFAAVSQPANGLRLVDKRLKVLGEFDRSGLSEANGHPRANMFDQPELEALLRAKMREQKSVTFRGGVTVTEIRQLTPSRVEVSFVDAATGEPETVETEFVLGCDGANSLVATTINSKRKALGFEQRWLVIDIVTKADLGQWDGVQQVCDAERAATYMPVSDHRHRWEFQLHDHEKIEDFASLEQLHPLLLPWLGDKDLHEFQLLRSAQYTFRAAVADRWRDGRIFILGDAAHLTPPFIGQGMCAGVRDAANLGWKVAGVWSGQLPDDVLDSYQAERAPHARSLILLARLIGKVMTSGGRTGDRLRRVLVPFVTSLPPVHFKFTDSTSPKLSRSGWVNRRLTDRLAGGLCPNVVLGAERFDQHVGLGWSLVTAEAPAPSSADALADGGCVVVLAAPGSELASWLRKGRATAALVRPDRTVLESGHDVTALCAAFMTRVSA